MLLIILDKEDFGDDFYRPAYLCINDYWYCLTNYFMICKSIQDIILIRNKITYENVHSEFGNKSYSIGNIVVLFINLNQIIY